MWTYGVTNDLVGMVRAFVVVLTFALDAMVTIVVGDGVFGGVSIDNNAHFCSRLATCSAASSSALGRTATFS